MAVEQGPTQVGHAFERIGRQQGARVGQFFGNGAAGEDLEVGVLDREIGAAVATRLEGQGVVVKSVGVKDVILPGEMKTILNQVVEAEKRAQANLIQRREETAATRSLLNTARLMDDNPTLLRLKELETLEKVTEKIGHLTVFGGLEGVMKDTVRIQLPAR